MRAIIMAAGTSQRLRPLTEHVPKTLLSLNTTSILDHILDNVRTNGITHVDIITGHGHDAVVDAGNDYAARHPEMNINYVFNDVYHSTGNIVSMRRALDGTENDDFILINSDTIFHADILKKLATSPHANAMIIDDVKTLGEEEMKVTVTPEDETITVIHKSLDPQTSHGEYIGVMKLSHDTKQIILKALDDTIAKDNSLYYEDAIQTAITDHGLQLHAISTDGLPAMEIDTPEDLADAKKLIIQMP